MWRNFTFPYVTIAEKFEYLHMWSSINFLHMKIWSLPFFSWVWCAISFVKINNVYNWWGFIAIYAILLLKLLFTLFCREIYFATIYVLSCGEKLSPKVHMWRKNDKYQVWSWTRCSSEAKIELQFKQSTDRMWIKCGDELNTCLKIGHQIF